MVVARQLGKTLFIADTVRLQRIRASTEDSSMEWLVALIGTMGIGFLLHAHIVARSQLSAKQLRAMRDLIERESMRIKAEREKIIARNPTPEKTIPLSQVVVPLERS